MGFLNQRKICNKAQFSGVFANRKKLRSESFDLYWCANDLELARIGVSVAKKNIAKATKRNKYKRLVKESFIVNNKNLPTVDMVIVVKKEALFKSNHLFVEELNHKWAQLKKSLKLINYVY